jgi:hypothetical protein
MIPPTEIFTTAKQIDMLFFLNGSTKNALFHAFQHNIHSKLLLILFLLPYTIRYIACKAPFKQLQI